jgi:hypothetical protein
MIILFGCMFLRLHKLANLAILSGGMKHDLKILLTA